VQLPDQPFASLQRSFIPLRGFKTALLTSFRRSGQAVGTPVGIIVAADKVYFATRASTGKVKRLRHTSRVTLAPCTRAGKPTGAAIAGTARRLEGAEAAPVERLFFNSLWGRLWQTVFRLLRPHDPWIVYEVAPAHAIANERDTMNTVRTTDERAIRELLQQAIDAWNAGDGRGYGAVFEEDADYVTFGGAHTRGRQAIAADHQQLFDTFLRGSRVRLDITGLRFLGDDIAIVHAVGGILDTADQQEVAPERRSLQTAVMRKSEQGWRIAANQVTRIQSVQPGVNVPDWKHAPTHANYE
jgi:uncharacterized protein (TIGR02246 family)/PPOX class probable F420-dependent enzyme